ncbi:LysR family transcriptional regulator [Actinocorallia longicatena]|uniref:LysR family transcriptional regulator n=1 Tax=Actinocorallia longicatena TaxID=111803 RepID=A0ABP6QA26_9ACTN
MNGLDLNLLVALDALLEEGGVTPAARRLGVSPPVMSRTLGRIREAVDDPILVRSGHRMIPTPRALELRGDVRKVVRYGRALLQPEQGPDPAAMLRRFTLRIDEMLLAGLASPLVDGLRAEAPGVSLCFRSDELVGTSALRDGRVDLELGVIAHADPSTRVEPLLTGRLIGVVREGHPLSEVVVTKKRYAAADHVAVSRTGRAHGEIDDLLAESGLSRNVVAVLPGYTAGLFMARESDVVCPFPSMLAPWTPRLLGLHTFDLPVEPPELAVSMAWHPRHDKDAAHRWLRDRVARLVLRN